MKKSHFLASMLFCSSMTAPGIAWAQTTPAGMTSSQVKPALTATVTDPGAPVSPVVYQSVFAGTPTGVEMESADWKKANAEVGQFKRGHADILKWDEAQTQGSMQPKPMATDTPKPAMSPTSPSPPSSPPTTSTPQPQPLRSSPAPQAPSVHKH